jgi:hypothetical protein
MLHCQVSLKATKSPARAGLFVLLWGFSQNLSFFHKKMAEI